MDHLTLLEHAEGQLVEVIHRLDEAEMDVVTNCPPWTVRRLASHALKNQLFWAGSATDQQLMPLDEAMGAVPYDGDLAPIADDVAARVLELWRGDGVMTTEHDTPFGRPAGRCGRRLRDHRRRRPRLGPVGEPRPRDRLPGGDDPRT